MAIKNLSFSIFYKLSQTSFVYIHFFSSNFVI